MTKPCARAGCPNVIERGQHSPKHFAKQRFCSKRCASLSRVEAGWKPHLCFMTPEIHQRATRKGGLATSALRRKARQARVIARLAPLLRSTLCEALTARQEALVKALLVRAYVQGRSDGYVSGHGIARREIAS